VLRLVQTGDSPYGIMTPDQGAELNQSIPGVLKNAFD
jgi:hypothetical protein